MNTPLGTLLDHASELLAADPGWGWYIGQAWHAGRPTPTALPPALEPFARLAALEAQAPDSVELSAAVDAAAEASGAQHGRDALLWHAGHLLPAPWAIALDELVANAPPHAPTPRFVDLARVDIERATRRVERAFAVESQSSDVPANLLYEALIACQDAGRPAPDALQACRARFEAADRFAVHEAARYEGRLRLAAREGRADAPLLAREAICEAGADEVSRGLWAVLARAPDPASLVLGWLEGLPRTPTPEVLVSLLARVGAASAAQVEAQSARLVAALTAGTENGRRAWPAAWQLLRAAVALGAEGAVDAILSLGPPRWAVELATYSELRVAPSLLNRIVAHHWEPEREDTPLESSPSPPWARLGADVFAARLLLLADPQLVPPAGPPWGDGIP